MMGRLSKIVVIALLLPGSGTVFAQSERMLSGAGSVAPESNNMQAVQSSSQSNGMQGQSGTGSRSGSRHEIGKLTITSENRVQGNVSALSKSSISIGNTDLGSEIINNITGPATGNITGPATRSITGRVVESSIGPAVESAGEQSGESFAAPENGTNAGREGSSNADLANLKIPAVERANEYKLGMFDPILDPEGFSLWEKTKAVVAITVSETTMKISDLVTGSNKEEQYEKYWQMAIEYESLANIQRTKALIAQKDGNFALMQDHVNNLKELNRLVGEYDGIALDIHSGNLDKAQAGARAVYETSKFSAKTLSYAAGPVAVEAIDYVFKATDYSITASESGHGEAAKELATDIIFDSMTKYIKVDGVSLDKALDKGIGQVVGYSEYGVNPYEHISKLIDTPENRAVIMKSVAHGFLKDSSKDFSVAAGKEYSEFMADQIISGLTTSVESLGKG